MRPEVVDDTRIPDVSVLSVIGRACLFPAQFGYSPRPSLGDEIVVWRRRGTPREDATVSLDEEARGAMSDQLLMSVDPDSDIAEDKEVSVVLDRTVQQSHSRVRQGLVTRLS